MKVVLREDVEKLGLRGEVVDVARGYARNFLLPRKLAEPATPSRVAELEKVNARRALNEAQSFEQAQEIAQRLGQAEIRFDVKAGENGVLFGSVTQTQLADAIWDKLKVRVDRRKIEMEPLKRIGRFQVPIELFADVTVETRVLVVPEGGELPPEEELQAIEEAEAAEAAAAEAALEEEHAQAEAAIEEEIATEEAVEEDETAAEAAPEATAEAEPQAPAEPQGPAEAEPEAADAEPTPREESQEAN
jgi:large subunit ribosomal protein L9